MATVGGDTFARRGAVLAGCSEKSTPDGSVCDNPPCEPPPGNCDNPPCEPPPGNCDNPPCEPPPGSCDNPPCEPPPECATTGSSFSDPTSGLNLEMVFVNCGAMKIGCTDEQVGCQSSERYAHNVELSSYYIGKFLVTQRQWAALMGTNPSHFTGEALPVETVSWDDAQAFIEKLNERSSRKKYRLPTNAEWEYAARGGVSSGKYRYSGGNNLDGVAWYTGNTGGSVVGSTHTVGTKAANELGLYDMSGNVYEWVKDYWEDGYSRGSFVDPQGPENGTDRVMRGGSWAADSTWCRVSARSHQLPARKGNNLGFRVALPAE